MDYLLVDYLIALFLNKKKELIWLVVKVLMLSKLSAIFWFVKRENETESSV